MLQCMDQQLAYRQMGMHPQGDASMSDPPPSNTRLGVYWCLVVSCSASGAGQYGQDIDGMSSRC